MHSTPSPPYRGGDYPVNILRLLDSRYAFWVLWLSGIVIRVMALVLLAHFPLVDDARSYHTMAEMLLLGENFAPYFPPGLPYYLSAWYALFGVDELVGRGSMILMYAAVSALLYLLMIRISTRRVANFGLLIISFFPAFVLQSIEPYTQLPVALCLLATILLLIGLATTSHPSIALIRSLLLGLVLGYATLVRPSFLLITLAVPLYLVVKTKTFKLGMTIFMVAGMVLSAWLFKAHAMTGRFVVINDANVLNFFFGNNPYTPHYKTWWLGSHHDVADDVPIEYLAMYKEIKQKPPLVRDTELRRIAIEHVLSRPDLFLLRTLNRIRAYFAFDSATGSSLRSAYSASTAVSLVAIALDAVIYLLIMVLTILFMVTYRNFALPGDFIVILFGASLLYSLPYWISFSHPTYHFPILPLFIIIASIAGNQLFVSPRRKLADMFWVPQGRRHLLLASLLLFCFVQVEWILVNLSRI